MSLSHSDKTARSARLGVLLDRTEFTPDEMMEVFAAAIYNLPENAMRWSIAHWDQAGPVFVQWLRDHAGLPPPEGGYDNTGLYITLLCGQMKETGAFAPLCQFMHNDEALDYVLGDAASELLGTVLLATWDGDPAPLKAVAMDPLGNEFFRATALTTLTCLAADHKLPRDYVHQLLLETFDGLLDEDFYAYEWTQCVACMDFSDLLAKAEALYAQNRLQSFTTLERFQEDLANLRANSGFEAIFKHLQFRPLGDVIEELSAWASFDGRGEREDRENLENELPIRLPMSLERFGESEPFLNPHKNVGRNDPCPCGSGKKFKKCCAA